MQLGALSYNLPRYYLKGLRSNLQEQDSTSATLMYIWCTLKLPDPKNSAIFFDTIIALILMNDKRKTFSDREKYSFLNLEIVENSNSCRKFQFLPKELN